MTKAHQYLLSRPSFRVLLNRAAGLFVFTVTLVLLAEVFTPSQSQANLPVIDVTAVSQMIVQTEQYAQQLANMVQQVALLKEQIQSLSGHYGMGNLGSPLDSWGGSSWSDIVNMVNTGINPGDAAQVAAYKTAQMENLAAFPRLAPSLQSGNPRLNAGYNTSYSAAISGMSAGQGTFNGIQSDLNDLQTMKGQIEKTPNVKAAVDLNTAVGIKNGQINTEILRVNALQLYANASTANNSTNGQAAEAEFFAN